MNESKADKKKVDITACVMILAGVLGCLVLYDLVAKATLSFRPEAMIGNHGLNDMQIYLNLQILARGFLMVVIPAFCMLLGYLYCRIKKTALRPTLIKTSAVIGLLFSLVSAIFGTTGLEIQGERFSHLQIVQLLQLKAAIKSDMDEIPVYICEDNILKTTGKSYGFWPGVWEYYLKDQNGDVICQISQQEFENYADKLCDLSTHSVRCYPNSGLLYDIDEGSKLPTEEELLESLYTVTYDEDGYLHWKKNYNGVYPENVDINYYIDGKLCLVRTVGKDTYEEPAFLKGHENKTYFTAVYKNNTVRVSNIVEVRDVIELDDPETLQKLDDGARAEAEVQLGPELIPGLEGEEDIYLRYLTTSEGLMITEDNPYYEDVLQAIRSLGNAQGVSVDSKFTGWYPIASLSFRSSDAENYFIVYMNTDIDKYDVTPQSEEDVYYRINGTIEGEEIERYVMCTPELKTLMELQKQAKAAQIRRICKRDGEIQAYLCLQLSSDMVELSADGCGRFIVKFDPDESSIDAASGMNVMVRVYDVRPATPEDVTGQNYEPDVVGKVEILK